MPRYQESNRYILNSGVNISSETHKGTEVTHLITLLGGGRKHDYFHSLPRRCDSGPQVLGIEPDKIVNYFSRSAPVIRSK